MDRAIAFYEDLFGMKIAHREVNKSALKAITRMLSFTGTYLSIDKLADMLRLD